MQCFACKVFGHAHTKISSVSSTSLEQPCSCLLGFDRLGLDSSTSSVVCVSKLAETVAQKKKKKNWLKLFSGKLDETKKVLTHMSHRWSLTFLLKN